MLDLTFDRFSDLGKRWVKRQPVEELIEFFDRQVQQLPDMMVVNKNRASQA